MSTPNPDNLSALIEYCVTYQDDIMVRVCLDGQWDSYPLSSVTFRKAMECILLWHMEGRMPVRRLRGGAI